MQDGLIHSIFDAGSPVKKGLSYRARNYVTVNDGGRKFHLEDVAFIDLKEYTERNGNAFRLTDQIERMYI